MAKKPRDLDKTVNWLWDNRIVVFSFALLILGIIFSFFYIHMGGFLVGVALGVAFFEEILRCFVKLRDFYSTQGLFKTLMAVGAVIYFLISIPLFIIGAAIGFTFLYTLRTLRKS